MNKELFQSMQKQMTPSPAVRAALSEKLAVKKRPVPWMKYGAVAACAALVIGGLSVYGLRQNTGDWFLITRSFRRDAQVRNLHSYVTVEGLSGYVTENTAVTENTMTGGGEAGALPNPEDAPSGALPGGAYVGDVPVQEGAEDYQRLMAHFNGTLPDWYGGAYLDRSGWLVVQLVSSKDPGDKTLELQVLDWAGSDNVMFSSCKYSLAQLKELMNQLNALPDRDMKCRDVMASWGVDEEANHIELTLTQVNNHILSILAELDPADDMILVQVGQRAVADVGTEDPAVHHAMPGGVVPPVPEDDANLIADEPYYDGAHYASEDGAAARRDILELPEQKQPAVVQSVPEEDISPNPERPVHGDSSGYTLAYDPDVGFIYPAQ